MKHAVVLTNLGGPTDADAVQPFLYNLFSDPDIIKLGGGVAQRLLARLISSRRAPKVAEKYAEIRTCAGGCEGSRFCPTRKAGKTSKACSPINPLTELQRQALENYLKEAFPQDDWQVEVAMRYWEPSTEVVLRELAEQKPDTVTQVPLYPQFSWTTTGSSLRDWHEVKKRLTSEGMAFAWQEYATKNYYQQADYLAAVNARIDEALAKLPEDARGKAHLLFSAHGTPLAEVRSGDPYTKEIDATVEAVMALRGHREPYWLSYQSRVGPAKWTQPNTEDLVERMLAYGLQHLVIVPIAFVTDHIETMMELDIELRELAEPLGLQSLVVAPGLNDHPLYIRALAGCVARHLGLELPTAPALEAFTETPKPKEVTA